MYDDVKKIICYHTHLELNDYLLGECIKLEHALSVWDDAYYRYVPTGFIYDDEQRKLLIPSGVSASWVKSLTNRPIEMNYDADPYENMHMRLIVPPRDILQVESMSFLAGKGQYAPYAKYPQLVLNLDTGRGKTYISIAQMAYKGLRTMIIVPTERIKSQWIEKIPEYTDMDPRKILVVVGGSMCRDIIRRPGRYKPYAVFIIKHATIRSFARSDGWESVHDLFKALGIGVKIYDEVHREFSNIIWTDCYTNTKFTYYLTATFGRSDDAERKIYYKCFANIPKFEEKKREGYEGKPHITYLCFFYKTNPTISQLAMMKTKRGFSRTAYNKYQMCDDDQLFYIISLLVKMAVIDKGYKTLLLMATVNGIEDAADYLRGVYPGIKIGTYHHKVSAENKAIAVEQDLIISTEKSLGEGADFPDLRAVINTESFKSDIIVEQIIGRLRKPPDGATCFYMEIVDKAFSTLRNQQRSREKFFKKMVGAIRYVKV